MSYVNEIRTVVLLQHVLSFSLVSELFMFDFELFVYTTLLVLVDNARVVQMNFFQRLETLLDGAPVSGTLTRRGASATGPELCPVHRPRQRKSTAAQPWKIGRSRLVGALATTAGRTDSLPI